MHLAVTMEVHLCVKSEYFCAESAVNEDMSPRVPFKFVTHCFFLTHRCLILGELGHMVSM